MKGFRAHRPDADQLWLGDARGVALVRIATVPALWMIGRLGYTDTHALFDLAAVIALVYVVGSAEWALRADGHGVRDSVVAGLDITMLASLLSLSGGLDARGRHVVLVLPLVAAFVFGARDVIALGLLTGVAYVAVSADALVAGGDATWRTFASFWVAIGWATLAGALIARTRSRRDERITALVEDRLRMAGELVTVPERERAQLSEALHDDALQLFVAAGQDLEDVDVPDEAVRRAAANLRAGIASTRALMRGAHPQARAASLDLEGEILDLAGRLGNRSRFVTLVEVEAPAVGVADDLVLLTVRELLSNAARHAGASTVTVRVTVDADDLVVDVQDDGVGLPPGRLKQSLRDGHLGLAGCRERARRRGGELHLVALLGGGTHARMVVPLAAGNRPPHDGAEAAPSPSPGLDDASAPTTA